MMNIKPSLRLYLLLSMFFTVVVTVVSMTIVSMNFYFSGLNFSKSQSMITTAYMTNIDENKAVEANEYIIASQWQHLPNIIKSEFNEQELVEGVLAKKIIGYPILKPPKAAYFVLKIKKNGQDRFISQVFPNDNYPMSSPIAESNFWYIFVIAAIAIVLFSLAPILILRNIATPIEKLILWSKQLDNEKLSEPIPPFHYRELDSLAVIIQSSLQSVQESLAREMRFLGYASHELRTPISVTRTNTELLQKMIEKNVAQEKQLVVLERIERASITMTDLTETLLWLNRQKGKSLPVKTINLGELTEKLVDELKYLLKGKNVELSFKHDDCLFLLPEMLCRIVINNLIRNAFQHTHEGSVNIEQSNSIISIINKNTLSKNADNELGFGLGLKLTERLVHHQNWAYKKVETTNGYQVEIDFSSQTPIST